MYATNRMLISDNEIDKTTCKLITKTSHTINTPAGRIGVFTAGYGSLDPSLGLIFKFYYRYVKSFYNIFVVIFQMYRIQLPKLLSYILTIDVTNCGNTIISRGLFTTDRAYIIENISYRKIPLYHIVNNYPAVIMFEINKRLAISLLPIVKALNLR